MKLKILFIALLISGLSWGQINENIQSWTNHAAYGTWTQVIPAGTVSMTQCIVANNAAATGTCTIGRIQMNASSGIVTLPTLPSVGVAEFHLAAGAAGRSVKLQYFDGSVWQDLTTFTGIDTTGATYTYNYNTSSATTLRLASPSAALYVHDIIITPGCTPPADPVGVISGTTPACTSTSLSFSGSVAPPLYYYWQTSATGQSTANNAASSLTANTVGTTNYYVRTYNSSTTCWSTNATAAYPVVINNNLTAVGTQPSNASIVENTNTSFTVSATNAGSYQWQVSTDGGITYNNLSNGGVYFNVNAATLNLTNAPLSMNGYMYKCIIYPSSPCASPPALVSNSATLTVTPIVSYASDIVSAAGEATTISSTINNTTISTSSNGVQVWQFTVRDGGGVADADAYPTILQGFTIAQVGNTVSTWTDAIYSIGLFDGTTFIANATSVTATQIIFSGLNVTVADDTSKTLSLRLSLKCPLGANAFDNDHFGFSISYANTTFSSSGSGKKATFAAATSNNTKNVIDVVATKLAFTTQPTGTGVNNTMSSVVVKATDACGNIDTGFTGSVSLTSTGTMNAVTPVSMTAGVATFTTIVHTATGTGLTLTASTAGLTPGTSATFDISTITTLMPGDIAILAFNTDTVGGGLGSDEVSFVTFVDITPGTRIDMTDNAYQKCGTPNGWGISEGWIRFERLNSTLPKGSIVTINVGPSGGAPSVYSPDPSNWLCTKPQPSSQGSFDLNNGGEQIFFMSGGNVGGTNAVTATSDGGTYSGNFIYGFNTKGNVWTPICGNSAAGGTKNSDKPKNFDCFLTWPTTQADFNKYTGPMTPATQRDWVSRISDSANWTGYADNTAYNGGPNFYSGSITILTGGYSGGVWIGDKNTDWFDCANWQSRKVPDATVNVSVGTNSLQGVVVDATSVNASSFNFIALCKDLAVSKYDVKIEGSSSNILEVNGNVTISSTGAIDMDDSNPATADGVIKLYGNWTNSVGSAAFAEGNGTVQFNGTGTQVISNVTPEGTETFYNVVLNNNFDTGLSNDLIASHNLILSAAKTLTVDSAGYVRVNNKLTNNGNVFIDSGGQLIQVNDGITNDGTYTGTTFQVKRTAMAKNADYIYWSSPLSSFAISSLPTNYRYIWNTTYVNANGTQGNWNAAPGGSMTVGKGYIARASNGASSATAFPVTFSGSNPNNGVYNVPVFRGNYTGPDYDADPTVLNADTTKYDDNWNLVGNPYPSAIDAEKFLVLNQSVIDGSVWIWRHGLPPAAIANPFYANFQENYSSTDYIKYNKLGSSDPSTFVSGKIASGQGFMVSMKDVGTFVSAGANSNQDVYSSSISFNNSLRYDDTTNPYIVSHDNTDFYRASNSATVVGNPTTVEEKHRIWLDIVNNSSNQSDRMLVGYSTNSTMERDNLYDCFFVPRGEVSLFSLINNESFIIQGRALPFDVNDRVPLGINIIQPGAHTIAIKKVDGMFTGEVSIYLEDKQLNIIHDLKQAPYVFNSEKGMFNNRFVLRYTNGTLGNHDFDSLDRNVVVSAKNGEMTINSYLENLDQVTVYDMLGRQLLEVKNIANGTLVRSNITSSQQALLVKIKLADGTIITRKIIL